MGRRFHGLVLLARQWRGIHAFHDTWIESQSCASVVLSQAVCGLDCGPQCGVRKKAADSMYDMHGTKRTVEHVHKRLQMGAPVDAYKLQSSPVGYWNIPILCSCPFLTRNNTVFVLDTGCPRACW